MADTSACAGISRLNERNRQMNGRSGELKREGTTMFLYNLESLPTQVLDFQHRAYLVIIATAIQVRHWHQEGCQ
jgi:hypothetical protein